MKEGRKREEVTLKNKKKVGHHHAWVFTMSWPRRSTRLVRCKPRTLAVGVSNRRGVLPQPAWDNFVGCPMRGISMLLPSAMTTTTTTTTPAPPRDEDLPFLPRARFLICQRIAHRTHRTSCRCGPPEWPYRIRQILYRVELL